MNPKIAQAREFLRQSQVGRKMSHLGALWDSGIWVEQDSQILDVSVEVSRDGKKINVYPGLLACTTPDKDAIREFGVMVFFRAGAKAKTLWEQKLTKPSAQAVEAFQLKLESGRFSSFREIVEDFKTAADRYVALNLANALISNHVPVADSSRINLKDWGPTSEYAAGKRRHKFACILSAYCPRKMLDCYGESFVDLVLNELRGVKEISVSQEFRSLLEDIADLAR